MSNALNYLGLARKAGLVELGEEPVCDCARQMHARLIIVASDATDHTWRRAKNVAAGDAQQLLRVPFTKEEMGRMVGRGELALAAFTDAPMALAFVQALPDPEKHKAVLEQLQARTQRIRQHRQEEKAHQRNKRMGKTHRSGKKNG